MDILNLASLSLIEALKLLVKILNLLANKEYDESQKNNTVTVVNNTALNESVAKFSGDLYEKTISFLKNNFNREDLTQISEKTDWDKQEQARTFKR